MSRERITSRSNPLISRLRKLKSSRALRREEGVFLCEGPKMLEEALRWNAEIELVLCEEGAVLPTMHTQTRVVEVPADLLAAAADTQTPQGIVFLCKMGSPTLPDCLPGQRFLVLDALQDPGNVGTIWRSADAFGADGIILCNGCADPWGPKTVRATMGAVFRLPVWECGLNELSEQLRSQQIPMYATALREDTEDVRAIDLSRAAVIIGSEGKGVSRQALELCEKTVKIPMRPRCESLNAAAAAAVVLWKMSGESL
jgi:RNA methyltransferase, TrmH family